MDGTDFVTFSPSHLVAVAAVLTGSVALVVVARAARSARFDRAMRWALAAGCAAFVAYSLYWVVAEGRGSLRFLLPLHLCDVSVFLAPVVLLTGHRRVFEVLYFWGIGGALQAIATPPPLDAFPRLTCISFFFGHGVVLASALYAAVVMRLRPTPRSIVRVWAITNLYGLAIIPVNLALDANYLFLLRKPAAPTLLDLMGPWPWYVLVLDAVAFAVICLCYAPYFVRDGLARRRGLGYDGRT
jgi:hypothetical integral membrane protein (TIGR02206 family)